MRLSKWTEDEKVRLLDLRGQGYPSSEIATMLGRTRNAICGALERMVVEGRDVPATAYLSGKPRRPRKPPPERQPKRAAPTMWEMDADDRRYLSWRRARQAAHDALQGAARDSPTIHNGGQKVCEN